MKQDESTCLVEVRTTNLRRLNFYRTAIFLERLSGVVETYISSRAGARAHTAIFRFLPSPFTDLYKVQ